MTDERKNRRRSNLRGFAISALVIIFVMAVILIYYAMLYSETRKNIIQGGELSSVASAGKIDQYLSKGVETLKLTSCTLDSMIRAGKTYDEIHDFLVNQSSAVGSTTSDNTTGIYGYIYGEYVDGTDWVPDEDYVPTDRPWYIDARANVGRVAVVDPYVDAQTNQVTITFSKVLCDAKSVVAMDYSMERLQAITEETAELEASDLELVLDKKYQVIAHPDKSQIGRNYLYETGTFGSELVSAMRSADESYFSLRYEGSDYMVYTVSLSNEWICISVYDATSVFSQIRNTMIFTIVASALVVALLLVLVIRSGRKESRSKRLSNIVEALAAAIDAKDTYTNGHSGRVADYAQEISRRFGFSAKKQEEIRMMALLHDVGKIGIPDKVINKPGKLTEEEYAMIKTHPMVGVNILPKTADMERLKIGVRWHHERYDGKGYPDGLAGEKIPVEARIIAVADAYDAMTSRRSYRDALPQAVVRSEIEKGKGTQFDPDFAEIMLQMIDEDKDYNMAGS